MGISESCIIITINSHCNEESFFLLLQASSSEGMGRWLGVLLAETGSTTDPATLHYDYIDVETTANVIQLAKQSFWWGERSYIYPRFILLSHIFKTLLSHISAIIFNSNFVCMTNLQ